MIIGFIIVWFILFGLMLLWAKVNKMELDGSFGVAVAGMTMFLLIGLMGYMKH